ncbi:RICIN domain-containing protein [Streptomyces morookaense]|uniref:RICIN domain-containing protein n=1 Tax=Streptomyces morookaense TaxID=1970 RepID=UPI00340C948F
MKHRYLLVTGAVAATAALTAFAPPAGASAPPMPAMLQYQNVATGKCLTADGNSVFPQDCNSTSYNQRWVAGGTGPVQLRNVAANTCLDTDGSSVFAQACGSGNQSWILKGANPYQLLNTATGTCVGTGGSSVYAQKCTGGDDQSWKRM